MGKSARKILDPLKLPDPLDAFGEKAEQARKDAQEQAQLDRDAIKEAQPGAQPTLASEEVSAARESERQRKLALSGQNSTILTGPNGAAPNNAGIKTLLGS